MTNDVNELEYFCDLLGVFSHFSDRDSRPASVINGEGRMGD